MCVYARVCVYVYVSSQYPAFLRGISSEIPRHGMQTGMRIGEKRRTLHFSEIRGEKEGRPREIADLGFA